VCGAITTTAFFRPGGQWLKIVHPAILSIKPAICLIMVQMYQ